MAAAGGTLGARAGIAEIAPALIGLDPRRVDRINDAMDDALVGHAHAKTPLDVACWDILGKSTGLAVCELLGGRTDAKMPVISFSGAGDPQDMRSRVAEHRDLGDLGQSVKIVGDEPGLDAARIEASLADKRPGEFFIVDANGGMTVETGIAHAQVVAVGSRFRAGSSLRQLARVRVTAAPYRYSHYLGRTRDQ